MIIITIIPQSIDFIGLVTWPEVIGLRRKRI